MNKSNRNPDNFLLLLSSLNALIWSSRDSIWQSSLIKMCIYSEIVCQASHVRVFLPAFANDYGVNLALLGKAVSVKYLHNVIVYLSPKGLSPRLSAEGNPGQYCLKTLLGIVVTWVCHIFKKLCRVFKSLWKPKCFNMVALNVKGCRWDFSLSHPVHVTDCPSSSTFCALATLPHQST